MKQFLILTLVMLLSLSQQVLAQGSEVVMADAMRSSGKIYVVVAVMLIILLGMIAYIVKLDQKISRFEQEFEG